MDTKYQVNQTGESILIPGQITIKDYIYTKKDIYKKGVCYRCQNRAKCSLTILIEFEEIKKINNKEKSENIKYTINSKQQIHTCEKKAETNVKNTECLTANEIKDFAKHLIKANLDKDMTFHIINFHKNKIMWNPKKIRKYVNDIVQENYPKDENFINSIFSSKINFNNIEKIFVLLN